MYSSKTIENLNKDIRKIEYIHEIDSTMKKSLSGVSRLVMLDRYAQKDLGNKTLKVGDVVVIVVKFDPKFPARGVGQVTKIVNDDVYVKVEEEYTASAENLDENNVKVVNINEVDKPFELFFEQIAKRVAKNLGENDEDGLIEKIEHELATFNLVPAGRVLFGAGTGKSVTYFNCFVMPFIPDSRGGISDHRKKVMEIMSRGGGVGTNGSTLRPKNALAKGVNGKSSGTVSWLNDLSQLTNLVEQGGSRRGAQMIMLADWHPDIVEFIISKMQNPKILKFIMDTLNDELVYAECNRKLRIKQLTFAEREMLENIVALAEKAPNMLHQETIDEANRKLSEDGRLEVNDPEFLTGANISVAITKEFIEAVEKDADYNLRFPDIDNYTKEQKEYYDAHWNDCGDVREWEQVHKMPVKVHKTIKAKTLWSLINICATYSAEPGVFFIDNANEMTNAKGYDQKVVCTNPCGEQPLAPFSVCNLSAVNLANMANRQTKEMDWDKFKQTITTAVKMQDNVIDRTFYFLEDNEKQALGERRVGLGVMGLHDLLIWLGYKYGSPEANKFVDKLFQFMSETAYQASIDIAKRKGSFPFLEEQGSVEKFINSGYMKKMPKAIIDQIKEHGIRNSHLLTVAPTGSTGTMVGVSTGLEPYFAFKYYRSGRLGKFIEVDADIVSQYKEAYPEYKDAEIKDLPEIFVSAMQLSPEAHVDTQCVIQKWIDSSISKTVNAPKGYSVSQVEKIYQRLYNGGAKGGTVYVDGSRDAQVLSLSNDDNEPETTLADMGLDVAETSTINANARPASDLKNDRQDRNIGVEVGDTCPICQEGIVEDIGGCNTCTNCNAQLKCGL